MIGKFIGDNKVIIGLDGLVTVFKGDVINGLYGLCWTNTGQSFTIYYDSEEARDSMFEQVHCELCKN